jgi:alpha-amylase
VDRIGYIGLKNHLAYIQGMGFDVIWIIPVLDNYDGGYYGYWGRDLSKLDYHFASEQDFLHLLRVAMKEGSGLW